jgi:hypothetical protein
MDMTRMEINAGDNDITVEVLKGAIEIGIEDGAEGLYGQLDVEAAEQLIVALEAAIAQARRNAA